MNLPPEFIHNIEGTFGEAGKQFLTNLPSAIDEASQRWGLTNVQPVPTLSFNFVAFAERGADRVVLKMGVPDRELKSEMAALRLFNGEGACRLLDSDEEKYWMLLERLKPGIMLLSLEDDETATHIAAEVMQKIWRSVEQVEALHATSLQNFIRLSDWFDGLKKLRATFGDGTGPFDEKLVARVERSVKDFFAENHMPVLMHGDFHHFNVLSSERGWLVIDPKGVIGPACYEVGPLLINPWGDFVNRSNCRQLTQRRIAILHEHLGFERERIREWGIAYSILSAWWSMESNSDWQHTVNFAKLLAELPV